VGQESQCSAAYTDVQRKAVSLKLELRRGLHKRRFTVLLKGSPLARKAVIAAGVGGGLGCILVDG